MNGSEEGLLRRLWHRVFPRVPDFTGLVAAQASLLEETLDELAAFLAREEQDRATEVRACVDQAHAQAVAAQPNASNPLSQNQRRDPVASASGSPAGAVPGVCISGSVVCGGGISRPAPGSTRIVRAGMTVSRGLSSSVSHHRNRSSGTVSDPGRLAIKAHC